MLDAVGLEPKRPPDTRDRRLREPGLRGHLTRRPVRPAVGRCGLQGAHYHVLDALVADRPRRARPRLIDQPIQALGGKPSAPLRDRRTADLDPPRDLGVALTLRARQHYPRAHRQPSRRSPPARPALQLLTLPIAEHDLNGPRTTRRHTQRLPQTAKKLKTQHTSLDPPVSGWSEGRVTSSRAMEMRFAKTLFPRPGP